MSCLKVYWPRPLSTTLSVYWPADGDDQDTFPTDAVDETAAVLLPISGARHAGSARRTNLLARARLLYENRRCPVCDRAAVEPIESQNALKCRDNMPVPGTGELLGFRCNVCEHEWDC